MIELREVKNRKILIDSNIPVHYASERFKERSGNPLRMLIDNGNYLAITHVSGFELLQAETRPDIREKYLKFLNYVPNIGMEQAFFNNAATLAGEYRRVCNNKKMPPCDLMIGGVILAYSFGKDKLLFLTTDRNDFCEPFWTTVAYHQVLDEDGQKIQVNIYLLEFNTHVLSPENQPS
jgi:hypothetical protein